jgi:hypothetical protein
MIRQIFASLFSAIASLGILGTLATIGYNYLTEQKEQQSRQLESIRELTELFYARLTHTRLVVSAIRHGAAPEEVRDRKKEYDVSYVKWNSELLGNLFLLRQITGDRFLFQWIYEKQLAPLYRNIDSCITSAYFSEQERTGQTTGKKEGAASQILNGCKIDELTSVAGKFTYEYMNQVYSFTKEKVILPDPQVKEIIQKICGQSYETN